MSIKEIQEEIIEEFAMFDDWMQKYDYLIELSKDIPLISEEYRLNQNLIKGCQSKVWLHSTAIDGKVIYTADSDAIITKGIAALLIRVLSEQKAKDILENEMYFIDAIGLKEHLSMTRSNGLVSMIKQMKFYALAFQAK
ncbi:MAG: Fe-S metabolism protein SufE [Bacteroidetes bacterium MED-G21]|nr:MAG: Fe-S metabolism protein SufE [Bacteroidetes bacterium MED-G21]|tara:strand:+ start:86 stop:502 length:417 start_codon:yes stop_codon:yes gene_type:complete